MFEGMFPNLAKGKASPKYSIIHLKLKYLRTLIGIPELGIDHFEPLIIDSVQVSKGSGSLVLTGGFKNLNIKGPSNATVSRARYVNKQLNITTHSPNNSIKFQFRSGKKITEF